ncbi:Peptidase S53 propeptide [Chthoniobacter flavus Ellin428]|uniref:Peptidase S53 propeptide n=1 Tax=Chthoniobacter flavus Ellin428 TaxID=497964 RepID=B4D1B3_9BACT|nr:Peptidase S53 propeptide [Chthoniobacter flavus Ellin428]TCO92770.1 putative secreted protein with VPAMP-CTERM motif [Chthoniobacter flavus]
MRSPCPLEIFRRVGLSVLLFGAVLTPSRAATTGTVVLNNSVAKVPTPAPGGRQNPHRPFVARAALQQAEVAAELEFEVALKMRNFADLQSQVAAGERIAPAEMAAKYFPLAADYQAVVDWLTSQGFKITRKDDTHLAVFARASVAKIQQVMKVNFAKVSMEGVEYTSAISAPSVPASLSPLLVGVNGLQPHLRARKHLVPAAMKPNSLTNTNPPYLPSQVAQAYQANGLYTAGINGTGQTVAIVIDTFPATADLQQFWTTYHVNQSINNVQFIQVIAGTLPAPSGEESLDVEWSSSIAPGAKVRVYATTDLSNSNLDQAYAQVYNDAVTHPEYGLHQVSLSFGLGETYSTASQVSTDSQYFANLVSAGVTVFASSGDGGSTPGQGAAGDTSGPVQVETPASDPNVIGVGGTSLTLNTSGNESSESAWNLGGGGTSIYFARPTWQTGTGLPAGNTRAVPDVSSVADPDTGAYVTLNGSQVVFGGTSWSSPTWAGFCALLNQSRANVHLPALGLLGPKLYPLLGTSNFRDITTGSNSNQPGVGYNAGVGFDLTTGIGVPNVQGIAQALVGVQTAPPALTTAPAPNATFSVATNATITSYQWQRMPIGTTTWSNLSNGNPYSGVTTATLTITNVTMAMSGDQFRCVMNAGALTSAPSSVLIVDSPLVISTLAGQVLTQGTADGTGTAAQFGYPSGVAVDSSGNIYVADFNNDTIRKITPGGTVTTPYGQPGVIGATNGTGTNATFNTPNGVAIDSANNIYVADSGNSAIRKITPGRVVSTLAGQPGLSGSADGTTKALFNNPQGVAVDSAGNVYVADTTNETIRKITPAGVVSTLAGTAGTVGYADGAGAAAIFNGPSSVAVDSAGNVYVADLYNFVVRKITPGGVVTTPYGQAGMPGRLDGIGTAALFNAPIGVAVDANNNLYITDSQIPPDLTSTSTGNNLVRRVNAAGVVSTIAGAGSTGSADGTGNVAQFYSLQAAAINSAKVVYLADTFNQTIRVGGIMPVVTTQLGSQTVAVGQPVTFSVNATGSGALTYRWFKGSNPISNATSASYTIPATASTDAGVYSVTVTDPFGSTTSSQITLTISQAVPVMPGWGFIVLGALLVMTAAKFLPGTSSTSRPR